MELAPEQLEELEGLLSLVFEPDNATRQEAEDTIQNYLSNDADMIVLGLITLLRSSERENIRSLCAVIMRRYLPNSEPFLIDTLDENLATHVKEQLLQAVVEEPVRYVKHQISECVSEIGGISICRDEWQELMPFLLEISAQTADPMVQECGLKMLGTLCSDNTDDMQPYLDSLGPIFYSTFAHDGSVTDLNVQVEGVLATSACIKSLDTEGKFEGCVGGMLATVAKALNDDDRDSARKILTALVELGVDDARFFRPNLAELSEAMVTIGTSDQLEDRLRHLCMEVFVTIAEDAPGMCRKYPNFIEAAIELAFSLMLLVEEEAEWGLQEESYDYYDDSNFDCGEMSMDRLATAIMGTKFVPAITPIIENSIDHKEWQHRHAALKAFGQVGEHFEYDQIPLDVFLRFVSDDHPRVRHAAISCIGQLLIDFAPQMQLDYHESIIPALVTGLSDEENPRNIVHAASAIFNFFDECARDTADLYMESILERMLYLLENGPKMVQAQAATTISGLATCSPSAFKPFYQATVPILKYIIGNASGDDEAMLRAKAMEAITFIGQAMGREVFRDDAKDIMDLFLALAQDGDFVTDDVTEQYMLQAWSRLGSILGEEFLPALPVILPNIYARARKEPDWSLLGNGLQLTSKAFTSHLMDKASACSMLSGFVRHLKQHYLEFLPQTADIMIPLITFYFNDNVRGCAINCLPELVAAGLAAYREGMCDIEPARELMDRTMSNLLEAFKTEPSSQMLQALVTAMRMVMVVGEDYASELVDEKGLMQVGDALLSLMKGSMSRLAKLEEQWDDEDFDDDMMAVLVGKCKEEDELNFEVSECIGAFIKAYKADFLPTFEHLLPGIERMINSEIPSTAKIAVYIWDDIVRHGGIQSSRYFEHFVPVLIKYCKHEDPELRQGSGYGLGLCAEIGKDFFEPYVDDALQAIVEAINDPHAKDGDQVSATDNLISALGRIIVHQNRWDMLQVWLDGLPLGADWEEAANVYGMLCTLIEQDNSELLGGDEMTNMPKIIWILCEALMSQMTAEFPELEAKIVSIVKTMQEQCAPSLWEQIPAANMETVQSVLNQI